MLWTNKDSEQRRATFVNQEAASAGKRNWYQATKLALISAEKQSAVGLGLVPVTSSIFRFLLCRTQAC